MELQFKILGQPFSKANSRKIVNFGGRPASIKSDKARNYEEIAREQFIKQMGRKSPLEKPVAVEITIYYPDRRQDLDPSLVLDIMQTKKDRKTGIEIFKGVYLNDRQVQEMHLFREIDKLNPRCEITVWEIGE